MMKSTVATKAIFLIIFIAALLGVYYLFYSNNEPYVIDAHRLSEATTLAEGYLVSKGMRSIWVSDEKSNFWTRLTKSYQSNSIQVFQHKLVIEGSIFRGIKRNEKVRVLGESILESNPPQIHAFSIELID